ncbi:acyltransferase family protein [Wohlfahrtiimonas populi]|uniref:acyltransferase family protein n=1 Tax=Wohlfahrtiimonas populi TaxID=1940240 RepID=UPI00098D0EBF|nr:acyltransferase family protein [Wohlfahrtiimonas populi]
MQFRTDINGLRAYAVLAVIIFHFNKQWLPGGFVGVDIFFVISGYLMTSIIFRGLTNQSFSLRKFYSARIRRIIPALLILIILLVTIGYLTFGPISYRNLTKESIRSLLFISNFLYARDTGYFDAGALSKPLLHTWSLSVEWQFYIIYPIILAVCAKFLSMAALKKLVLTIGILSLAFTLYFSKQSPMDAYFLLPTRIWEMILGGIVFLYPLKTTHNWQIKAFEITGLLIIIASFFIINEAMLWPGYMAIIPTLGAFLLIQANGQSILTKNIVFQKVGLWSYSLYLYHWPLLYINHRYNLDMSIGVFLLITFIFSTLSYYLIETRKWNTKYIIIIVLIALIPIYGIYKTKGAAFRVVDKYNLTAEEFNEQYYGGGSFPGYAPSYTHPKENNDIDYVIVGDSYSRQYVKYILENKISTRTWFADACLFMPEYKISLQNQELTKCTEFVDQFDQTISTEYSDKPIIWAQSWDYNSLVARDGSFKLLTVKDAKKYYEAITLGIKNMIEKNKSRNIYLIGVYTRPNYNIYECLSSNRLSRFTETCNEFAPREENPINAELEKLAKQYPNVYFINPNDGLCNEQGCRMLINNEPIFSDMGHLSIYGADIVGKYIFDKIHDYETIHP